MVFLGLLVTPGTLSRTLAFPWVLLWVVALVGLVPGLLGLSRSRLSMTNDGAVAAVSTSALALASVVVLVGVLALSALASLGLMFYAGRRQSSWILMALFTGWVLGPYAGLLVADRTSGRWSSVARVALYGVMLTSTIGSVAIYAFVTLGPPRPKPWTRR